MIIVVLRMRQDRNIIGYLNHSNSPRTMPIANRILVEAMGETIELAFLDRHSYKAVVAFCNTIGKKRMQLDKEFIVRLVNDLLIDELIKKSQNHRGNSASDCMTFGIVSHFAEKVCDGKESALV